MKKLRPIHPGEILLEEFLEPLKISQLTHTQYKSFVHYKTHNPNNKRPKHFLNSKIIKF